MKAAELLVRCLENEKVEYIFGIPGEENIDVMDALLDSPIKFVTTHHEQGAAFMADVYGRLTGRAGVCMSTLGPGATNLITGVADANMDRAPIVAIAGQGATTRLHKESHQILDLVGMFQPITKYSTQILEPGIVPEIVRKAFKVAQTEKPGATFIDFPENVAEMQTDKKPIKVQRAYTSEAPAHKVAEAAKLITAAKAPLILAGNGVIRQAAADALVTFAEALRIPVANTFMAKGVMPFTNELSLGTTRSGSTGRQVQSRKAVAQRFETEMQKRNPAAYVQSASARIIASHVNSEERCDHGRSDGEDRWLRLWRGPRRASAVRG